ncbi:hypothetical protein [Ferrimonas balearica]|uniref:hypothetical protein n=1 Tax=Ferrimonas balearica TaxID=44012 RepID=UPI001C99D657|nr:hypothetical protein [Ferrimonas balearica]MBY5991804.1 hypothetical protein [Ferrimonas balearica]
MDFNATLMGQLVLLWMPLCGVLSYYLGRRKTQTPRLVALVGLLLAVIPPLGLVYLAALALKADRPTEPSA